MGGDARVLESTCRVGPFELEGVPHVYWESVKTGLSTCSTFRSCPLIVRATSVALNRSAALAVAKEQLYDLCALLSLEWEQCSPWVLRDDPYDSKRHVPTQDPYLSPDFGGSRENWAAPTPLPALTWVPDAWEKTQRNYALRRACHAFYEGERLSEEHPSFALIAYVAAVETIGAAIKPGEEARENMRTGLGVVLSPSEAGAVLDTYYRPRSATGASRAASSCSTRISGAGSRSRAEDPPV